MFPWIGGGPIAEITAPAFLKVLGRVEGRGAGRARRNLFGLDHHRPGWHTGANLREQVSCGVVTRQTGAGLEGCDEPTRPHCLLIYRLPTNLWTRQAGRQQYGLGSVKPISANDLLLPVPCQA